MAPEPDVRLDRWLWAARLFKTRALASAAAAGGKVRVNGTPAKPAKAVRVGDRLDVRHGPYLLRLTVRTLVERRVSADRARTCYEEDPAGKRAREALVAQVRLAAPPTYRGKGRPTKKTRRDLERWQDRA